MNCIVPENKIPKSVYTLLPLGIVCALLLLISSTFLNHHLAGAQPSISSDTVSAIHSSNTTKTKPQIQWAVYKNNKFDFTVEYPRGWQIEEKQNRFMEGPALKIESNTSMLDQNHGSFDFSYKRYT